MTTPREGRQQEHALAQRRELRGGKRGWRLCDVCKHDDRVHSTYGSRLVMQGLVDTSSGG